MATADKPVSITRKEYDALTKEEQKRYYWHNGKACLKKINRAYYEQHLRRARLNAATAIAKMFERRAEKAKMVADKQMYQHAAKLVENWRDSHYGVIKGR